MASSNLSDVIVIGAGVEGSAAAYNIASHGKKVILLEQVHSKLYIRNCIALHILKSCSTERFD